MNLRTLASTSALALLFAGAIAGQAHAQVVFSGVSFALLANGDITGTGSGVTLVGTSTGLLTVGSDEIDALTVTATDGPYSYSGSSDLFITGPAPFVGTYGDGPFSFTYSSATAIPAVSSNGVVTFAAVPEPNSVAMLAGLAIAGSGFASRRLRRRNA
jgi:hypothetical protein